MDKIVYLGIADAFQNPFSAWVALFLLFLLLFTYVISKLPIGRGDNRGVGVMISFIMAILAAHGFVRDDGAYLQFPSLGIPFNFDFLYSMGFYTLGDFLNNLGILGIPVILAFFGVIYLFGRAFFKFLRINLGVGR